MIGLGGRLWGFSVFGVIRLCLEQCGLQDVEHVDDQEGCSFPTLQEVLGAQEEPQEQGGSNLHEVVEGEGLPRIGDGGDGAGESDDAEDTASARTAA